jgi:hypothetical protein
MNDRIRTRIAAGVTALFLAGVSIAGVATHRPASQPSGIAPAAVVTQQRPAAPSLVVASDDHEESEDD